MQNKKPSRAEIKKEFPWTLERMHREINRIVNLANAHIRTRIGFAKGNGKAIGFQSNAFRFT